MDEPDRTVLVFGTQAEALAAAVAASKAALPAGGDTLLLVTPRRLVDDRWYLPRWAIANYLDAIPAGYSLAQIGEAATNEVSVTTTLLACLELRDRFTDAEMGTITVAASRALDQGDPRLQMLLDTMGAAVQLDLTDPRVQQGIGGLVAFGLLTVDRAGVILAPVGLLPQPGVS